MKHTAMCLLLSLMMSVFIVAQEKQKNDTPKEPTTDATKDAAKDATKDATKDAAKKEEKPAASAAAALPASEEILEKYIKALGGKDACLKLSSRIVKGTFQIETMNTSGSVEAFTKAPNKNATIITIDGFGTINSVFDGSKGWSNDPFNGFRELAGIELAAIKRDSDFYSMLNFNKNFPKLVVKGTEKVGTSEAYVIEATPAEGTPEKFYFDVKTGLLTRHDSERESPQGKIATEQYLEDYKLLDGVYFPHTMKQVTPMFAVTIKFTEVKNNTEIEETKFNKPSPTQ
jgi:zinc protease